MKAPSKAALTSFLSAYLALASISSLENQVLAEPETANTAEIVKATQTEIKPVSLEISSQVESPVKPPEQKPAYETPIETKYSLILEQCKETNAEAIKRTRKVSGNLEKSIEKYGFDYVVGIKNDLDKSCLDLTLRIVNGDISEEDYEKEKQKLAREQQEKQQKTNISAPINFTSEKMINAQKEKISTDIEFYRRFLKTSLKVDHNTKICYEDIIKAGFSEQEYREVIAKQLDATNKIYDAMLNSRTGLRGFFAVPEINNVREARMSHYKEEAKKVYKSGDKQVNKQPDTQEIKQQK